MLIESLSGVRGIFGSDITQSLIRDYVSAYAAMIRENGGTSIAIGRDTRQSSEEITDWVQDALRTSGLSMVYDCGIASTPAMHVAVKIFEADGGIIITGSSNELSWNGLKFLRADGGMLYPEESDMLTQSAHSISLQLAKYKEPSVFEVSRRLTQEYVLMLLRIIGDTARKKLEERSLKILIDANGGTAYQYAKELFDRMHIEAHYRTERNGEMWRSVKPTAESIGPLLDALDVDKLDFAVAFDADADQMEFVLPKHAAFATLGSPFVSGQYVLGLAVKAVLEAHRGDPPAIVVNNATSQLVYDTAKSYGAETIEVDVGEINVVQKMRALHSIIGGEGASAGVIVPPMEGRDGLLTLAVILRYLAESEKTLDEALLDLPRYHSAQANVECELKTLEKLRTNLIVALQKTHAQVTVFNDDGAVKWRPSEKQFVTFRASKTEPGIYRIIADAKEKKDAEDLLEKGKKFLQALA